jgi:hypothetical protein
MVFVVSDALALFYSMTSMMMFLGILNACFFFFDINGGLDPKRKRLQGDYPRGRDPHLISKD